MVEVAIKPWASKVLAVPVSFRMMLERFSSSTAWSVTVKF